MLLRLEDGTYLLLVKFEFPIYVCKNMDLHKLSQSTELYFCKNDLKISKFISRFYSTVRGIQNLLGTSDNMRFNQRIYLIQKRNVL